MNALDEVGINVAEAIPYRSFKEQVRLIKQELEKNRHVEVLDELKVIYSSKKWEVKGLICKNCKFFKKSNQYSGYCRLWESYTKAEDECDDGEEG